MRAVVVVVVASLVAATTAPASPAPASPAAGSSTWASALGAEDRREIERAVTAITTRSSVPPDPDLLFAAARACEDQLDDPARAVAIYDRILAEYPDARVATASRRRVDALRALVGPNGETAALAAELAQLTARVDALPAADVLARGELLASAAWPGAPAAALWLADWLRRTGRLAEAHAHYAIVVERWPDGSHAHEARRGAVSCALDAHDWALAERLASQLPALDPADRSVRDDLRAAAARGRRRERWYAASWLVIVLAIAALIASLAEAALRSPAGTRRSVLRPPIEVVFLGPVAAVLIGVAFTAHRLIAPAVATIATGGLVLAWLSGAALERLRVRGRGSPLRGVVHLALCLAAVASLAYIAMTRDHLLDLLIETVRFGPET